MVMLRAITDNGLNYNELRRFVDGEIVNSQPNFRVARSV